MIRFFGMGRLKPLMDMAMLLATLFLLNRAVFEPSTFSDDVHSGEPFLLYLSRA
jgi:hypothetical protein